MGDDSAESIGTRIPVVFGHRVHTTYDKYCTFTRVSGNKSFLPDPAANKCGRRDSWSNPFDVAYSSWNHIQLHTTL